MGGIMMQRHILDELLKSVHAGARIGLYSTFTALTRVAICFGPLGAALMFWWSGNVWEIHVIEQIMLVGVGLSAISILPMFLFNDDKTLGADSEAYQELLTIEGELSSSRATPQREANSVWSMLPYPLKQAVKSCINKKPIAVPWWMLFCLFELPYSMRQQACRCLHIAEGATSACVQMHVIREMQQRLFINSECISSPTFQGPEGPI